MLSSRLPVPAALVIKALAGVGNKPAAPLVGGGRHRRRAEFLLWTVPGAFEGCWSTFPPPLRYLRASYGPFERRQLLAGVFVGPRRLQGPYTVGGMNGTSAAP